MDERMRKLIGQVSEESQTDKPPPTHGGQQPLRYDRALCCFCWKVLNSSPLSGKKEVSPK